MKQGRPRSLGDEIFRDGAIAHMRSPAERRFPIAEPPVPGSTRQRRLRLYKLLHAIEVEVGNPDHFACEVRRLGGERIAHLRFFWSGRVSGCGGMIKA